MSLRDPNVQKVLIVVVAAAIIGYLYFGTTFFPFCYQVKKAEIEDLNQQYSKLSADLEKARKTVGKLAELEARYEKLHDQWLHAQELLPAEQEMPELLRRVTTAGNKAGVDFTLFKPMAVVPKEVYKEHPVQVQVKGGYHNLGLFLSRLANMPRIINVEQMKIETVDKRSGKKDGDVGYTVIADFTIKAYTLMEGAEYENAEGEQNEQG